MSQHRLKKGKYNQLGALLLAGLMTSQTHAAGFQIFETSVAGLGRAYAGNGVAGDSLSDMFANPAALSLYNGTRLEAGLHILDISAKFENQGSITNIAGVGSIPTQGTDSDGGVSSVIPNFYYSHQINDNMTLGLGVTSPFGLATEYDRNWIGRYAAIKSELISVEINPALAYKVNDTVSLGGGITFLRSEVELTRAQFTGPGLPDAYSRIEGDDTATGWNLGAMFDLGATRVGLGYRSEVDVAPEGSLSITPLGVSAGARAEVTLPQTAYLSAAHAVGDKIEILGGVRWTDWSSFDELRIQFDNGLPDSVTPENWSESYAYSLGMNYHASDALTYRAGITLDESPVSDEFRTARIPDADRTWLSFGAGYKVSNAMQLDLGYTHIFTDNASINETTDLVSTSPGAVRQTVTGEYVDSDVNIFSASLQYRF